MKKAALFIIIVLVSTVLISAQRPPETEAEKLRRLEKERQYDLRVNALRNNGKTTIIRDRYKNTKIYIEKIRPLYRDLEKDEEILLAPDARFSEMFSKFLAQKDTGLIKLIMDKGCDKGTQVVDSSPHCVKYKMPGAGASYSFRTENYRLKHLGDLTFAEDAFQTAGPLKHGILVNIGDVPLESVNLKMEQLKTLADFQATKDLDKAEAFAILLDKGIQGGDLLYKSNLPIVENTTYVLRSIAYRGYSYKAIDAIGYDDFDYANRILEYDEFDFDDRRDVIIAFRVVKLDKGESATILWKKLADQKTPKLN